jgi:hypothetical protein
MQNSHRNRALLALFTVSLVHATELSLSLENQFLNPLLPGFYEAPNKRFMGIRLSVPIFPWLDLMGEAGRSHKRFDPPYNDVSNIDGETGLLKLGAATDIFRTRPVRFFVGVGIDYLNSSWDADDHAYEDPRLPKEFWTGRFTRWAFHTEPGFELFRENQAVDWSLSFRFPIFFALPAKLKNQAYQERFQTRYLQDKGVGMTISIGVNFKDLNQ